MLTHGDLGTGEKIASLQKSRSIEWTLIKHLAHIVFIPGMFHIKMACATSIWKLYISGSQPKKGEMALTSSIFAFCAMLRPKEIAKLKSNPGFRMTHDLINHVVLATILEAWSEEIQRRHGISVAQWIDKKPKWEELTDISHEIVRSYVADWSFAPGSQGDATPDTIKLWNRDALLYVATSYAANSGDVQRVEELLLHWIFIWKATSQHRYAKHIGQFLVNLDAGWERPLARAVRLNWFVNPTGKPNGFRGVDWVIERNNLRHKRTYSGQGPNRTIKFIIKQSPLIEVYQNTHSVVENSFYLTNRTLRHPPPPMKKTLAALRDHMRKEKLYTHNDNRREVPLPRNAFLEGLAKNTDVPPNTAATDDESDGEADVDDGDVGVDELS
ncbi:hypothetical protein FRB90_012122 [Tulasnella sp. 427]|nr:hypothetical protein FRB90_012122 [Tulasnella sp. 427]